MPSEQPEGRARKPVAIVDIGSNSVRLVAYDGLSRAPTPIFNEKILCGLGRGVVTTGRLPKDGVAKALAALRRFRVLCDGMRIADVHVLATAAARDAVNGAEFVAAAQAAIGAPVDLLPGRREAELSALGVMSSFFQPNGVVGDLGGGSLELVNLRGHRIGRGETLPIGGLALMDASQRSPKKAVKIVRDALAQSHALRRLEGRTFYAVGGTWRAFAKLHMRLRDYPLNVMHGYVIPAREAGEFAGLFERADADAMNSISAVSSARRPLLAYGAVVLEEIIRSARPKEIAMSAMGVRDGLLFERLSLAERRADPLLAAAGDLNRLLSRDPQHGVDLCAWTEGFIRTLTLKESAEETRLRHAVCLLSDIAWRAQPDYRGEQCLSTIAYAALSGVDHPGRIFIAIAAAYRHLAPDEDVSPALRSLVSPPMLVRARVLGAALRVAYVLSAAMPGVLPRTPLTGELGAIALTLPHELGDLASERLHSRMKQIARLTARDAEIRIMG